MTNNLASGDVSVVIPLMALLAIIQIVHSVATFWIAQKARKIDALEASLEAKSEKLIEAKFATLAAQLQTPIATLDVIVQRIEKRLARGDEEFGSQAEQLHQVENRHLREIAAVKTWADDRFALRSEFEDARREIGNIRVALGRVEHR